MKVLISILIILTSMTMALWGYSKGFEDMKQIKDYVFVPYPITEREVVIKNVIVEKEVVVFKGIIVERPVAKIIYEPIFTRDWESIEQFEGWFEELGLLPLRSMNPDYLVDCEDYITRMQREAVKDGYNISLAMVRDGYYYDVRVTEIEGPHAGALICVGEWYYYVELGTNGGGAEIQGITKVAPRD